VGVTNGLALPIPELTEGADGPAAFGALANGVEDYILDRILPGAVTHYPVHHWGSGTALPTAANGVKQGDLYLHTGLGCTMRFISGTTWRQAEPAQVANLAARDALATNYAGLLYDGFELQVLAVVGPPAVVSSHWRWNAGTWVVTEMARAMLYANANSAVASASTWFTLILQAETVDTHNGHALNATGYTVPTGQGGLWEIDGTVHYVGLANPSLFATRIAVNDAVIPNVGHGAYVQSVAGGAGMMPTGRKLVTLAAGDVVTLQGYGGSIWQGSSAPALGQSSQLSLTRIG
jgi:hypothetical protein